MVLNLNSVSILAHMIICLFHSYRCLFVLYTRCNVSDSDLATHIKSAPHINVMTSSISCYDYTIEHSRCFWNVHFMFTLLSYMMGRRIWNKIETSRRHGVFRTYSIFSCILSHFLRLQWRQVLYIFNAQLLNIVYWHSFSFL